MTERKIVTFVKSEKLGDCPCCNKEVLSDTLYVKEETNTYHLSCFNKKKAEEK
jgi:transcription elongation factor Elf1